MCDPRRHVAPGWPLVPLVPPGTALVPLGTWWLGPPLPHPALGRIKGLGLSGKAPRHSTLHGESDGPSPASIRPVFMELQPGRVHPLLPVFFDWSGMAHCPAVRWPIEAGKEVAGSWRPQGVGCVLTSGRLPLVHSDGSQGRLRPVSGSQPTGLLVVSTELMGDGHLLFAPSTPVASKPDFTTNPTGWLAETGWVNSMGAESGRVKGEAWWGMAITLGSMSPAARIDLCEEVVGVAPSNTHILEGGATKAKGGRLAMGAPWRPRLVGVTHPHSHTV